MKKILLIVFAIIGLVVMAKAQMVYTPNGSRVLSAELFAENVTTADIEMWLHEMRSAYPQAEIIGQATITYNCHAYAWHMSEGGTPSPVWINSPNIYWEDGSYIETTADKASKVFYDNGIMLNHSAITTGDVDIFISKWGRGFLVKHHKNDSPYYSSNLKYYRRPLYITGSPTVCSSGGTYTLVNGTASSWTVSPANAFTVTASNATSATVTATTLAGQMGELTAVVNGENITLFIRACTVNISGPSTVCPSGNYTLNNASANSWSVTPANAFTITASNATSATVTATALTGQSGTLTAVVNGVSITKAIEECNMVVAINGPTTVCATGAYELDNAGQANSWNIAPTNAFTITASNATAATVTATTLTGQSGTLTAVVNGRTITKTIHACSAAISGNSLVCDTRNYTLSNAQADMWNVTPAFLFSITSSNATAATVTATALFGQSGTLTAVVNGANVTKVIQACAFNPNLSVFNIYPNPASSILIFQLHESLPAPLWPEAYTVYFYSATTGALVYNQTINILDYYTLGVSTIPNGLYVLQLWKNGTLIQTQTIAIQH